MSGRIRSGPLRSRRLTPREVGKVSGPLTNSTVPEDTTFGRIRSGPPSRIGRITPREVVESRVTSRLPKVSAGAISSVSVSAPEKTVSRGMVYVWTERGSRVCRRRASVTKSAPPGHVFLKSADGVSTALYRVAPAHSGPTEFVPAVSASTCCVPCSVDSIPVCACPVCKGSLVTVDPISYSVSSGVPSPVSFRSTRTVKRQVRKVSPPIESLDSDDDCSAATGKSPISSVPVPRPIRTVKRLVRKVSPLAESVDSTKKPSADPVRPGPSKSPLSLPVRSIPVRSGPVRSGTGKCPSSISTPPPPPPTQSTRTNKRVVRKVSPPLENLDKLDSDNWLATAADEPIAKPAAKRVLRSALKSAKPVAKPATTAKSELARIEAEFDAAVKAAAEAELAAKKARAAVIERKAALARAKAKVAASEVRDKRTKKKVTFAARQSVIHVSKWIDPELHCHVEMRGRDFADAIDLEIQLDDESF